MKESDLRSSNSSELELGTQLVGGDWNIIYCVYMYIYMYCIYIYIYMETTSYSQLVWFFHILGIVIIPIDFHLYFSEGLSFSTTRQTFWSIFHRDESTHGIRRWLPHLPGPQDANYFPVECSMTSKRPGSRWSVLQMLGEEYDHCEVWSRCISCATNSYIVDNMMHIYSISIES